MTREEAKDLFRNDKDAYGKPRGVMGKIDQIFDAFEEEKFALVKDNPNFNRVFKSQSSELEELDQIMHNYSWIKVKSYRQEKDADWQGEYARLEKHHKEETNFLIKKCGELASRLKNIILAEKKEAIDFADYIQEKGYAPFKGNDRQKSYWLQGGMSVTYSTERLYKDRYKKETEMEFSIGPNNESHHNMILEWLKDEQYIQVKHISFNGDHYSEITCQGDYNRAWNYVTTIPGTSIEHWED